MYEQDEKTIEQPVASETEQTSEETQGQSAQAEEELSIPEKFVGKSVADVAQAYQEVESEKGRLASELGSLRKDREELEAKFRDLERQAMQMPTQQPSPQQVPIPEEVDPLSAFDARFEEDPKEAIKATLRAQQEQLLKSTQEQTAQQRASEAQSYYWQQKKENPDYARREPLMQQAVSEFQDVIRPEHLNSVKVLKALDLISKGMDLDYYSKQAIESAQKDGLSVRDEKRRAQSESTHSEGDTRVAFEKLSLKDMEQFLGESDD